MTLPPLPSERGGTGERRRRKKKSIPQVAVQYGLEYGLPTAVGAGVGALAGGPLGAVIGGAGGLGSAIAGPKVAKALPEGTPGPIRTATEYGIYGLGGGLGIGAGARAAGKVGAARILEALTVREAAKLGALSAAGAAAGEQVGPELGLGEGLSEILGSIAGPTAGPGAFRHARSTMFNRGGDLKNIARALGATEANSTKIKRVIDPKSKPLGAVADDIAGLRRDAEQSLKRIREPTGHEDDYVREITRGATGHPTGYDRAYIEARARGWMPPALRQATTPAFLREQRSLKSSNARLAKARADVPVAQKALEQARGALEETRAKAGITGPGELVNDERRGIWLWRAADGSERAVPDETAALLTRDAESLTTAENRLRTATENAVSREAKLKALIGSDDIPESLDEQLALLRTKHIPNWEELVGGEVVLDQEIAKDLRRLIRTEDAARIAKITASNVKEVARAERMNRLATWLEANPDAGPITPKMRTQAAIAFDQWELAKAAYTRGGGIRATAKPQSFRDWMDYVATVTKGMRDRALKGERVSEMLKKPYGNVYLTDDLGMLTEVEAIHNIDIKAGTADIQPKFKGPTELETVPLDKLGIQYGPEALSTVQAELNLVDKADRARLRKTFVPTAQERTYTTRAQFEQQAASRQNRGLAVQEGPILEELVDESFKNFRSFFLPPGADAGGRFFTPEHEILHAARFDRFASLRPSKLLTKEGREAFHEAKSWLFQRMQERLGDWLPVDDLDLLDQLGAGMRQVVDPLTGAVVEAPDPRNALLQLLQVSVAQERGLLDSDAIKLSAQARQFLERNLIGQSVTHPGVRGLISGYYASLEATANVAAGTYSASAMARNRVAARLLGDEGPSGIRGRLSAAVRKRSLAPITDNLLSHQEATPKLLAKYFNPKRLPKEVQAELAAIEKVEPGLGEKATNWLMSQFRTFVDMPQAFPGMPKEMHAFRESVQYYDDYINKGMTVFGSAPQTNARRLMMLLKPEYREFVNQDAITASGASKLTLLREALIAAKGKGKNLLGKPAWNGELSDLVVFGHEADMAWPLAGYQSMAMGEMFKGLKRMANKPVTDNDLLFRGGNWQIRSLNKWDPEMQESLKGLTDIVQGKHKWGNLQRLSQQVALGVLAADLSVLGIQGFKYAAQSILAGHPLKAVNTLRQGMTTIMTDYGFYAWMRANLDEVQYYSSLGLKGGVKGYIAGPDLTKMPLEHLPLVGRMFTGIREGTDLQFNRMLYYWKIEGIRSNLEFAKTMRLGHLDDAIRDKFIESSPTHKAVVDEMGGLDNYLLGTNEEVARAVVRQVNRSMGGVDLNAEGIGMTRQALEQIMLVVPGFFRSQVGQWAAILTKPNSVEGQLALSMLAREYLFAGGVAMGISNLMGTEDRVNFEDITKPTWLGVPMPDHLGGGTVSLLPTMSIPRLASRVVKETVTSAAAGDVPNIDTYLESFARGRLSPVVSAADAAISGEDFFGRKYESNYEKWGMVMSQVALPIIASSLIEDISESIKQGGATGDYQWDEVMTSTVANLLGKGAIPRHPGDKLNTASRSVFGTDWNLLTDAEKRELRNNPSVVAAEAEYDFYSNRRASGPEARVDLAYKQYGANVDKVWTEPTSINGRVSTQDEDDTMLAQGEITGEEWRDRYHTRSAAAAQWFEALNQDLKAEGIDPDVLRKRKLERLEGAREPGDIAWLVQAAKAEYQAVEPRSEKRTVATPTGEATFDLVDWNQFQDDREAVLLQYPSAVRELVLREVKVNEPQGVTTYRKAADAQQAIEDIPRYRGLSVDQGNTVDAMLRIFSATGEQLRGKAGLPQGESLPQGATQRVAVQQMQQAGLIRSEADMQLVAIALAMSKDRKLVDRMRNPVQMQAVLANPLAVIYYPYLRYRVPRVLWPQLPQQIFSSPVVQAELQASG